MAPDRLPQEQDVGSEFEGSAVLSDLTRWIAILAAPHGYVASAHHLGGIRGNRLLLQAVPKTASDREYVEEVPLESLQRLGAAAVASAFDRAARTALAAAERAGPPLTRPAKG